MEITALILLIIISIIGFGLIFFTNVGTAVILAGCVLYTLLTQFKIISVPALLILITLYLIGEVCEYLFIVIGAKKFGASNKAVLGAIIGGIVGAVIGSLFFGIGLLLGTFLGIFFGAFLVELLLKKNLKKSIMAGTGGVVGRIGATAAKLVIAVIMFTILIINIIKFG
ncbi:MAG: DUF456 domain-containing protein [bacterium]